MRADLTRIGQPEERGLPRVGLLSLGGTRPCRVRTLVPALTGDDLRAGALRDEIAAAFAAYA